MSNPKDLPLGWMALKQFQKLSSRKNVAKTHWLDMDYPKLLELLEQEVDELFAEVEMVKPIPSRIIDECLDVANFATMIAHKAREQSTPAPADEDAE